MVYAADIDSAESAEEEIFTARGVDPEPDNASAVMPSKADDLPDSDTLLGEYIEHMAEKISGEEVDLSFDEDMEVEAYAKTNEQYLTDAENSIYDAILDHAEKIARGEATSAIGNTTVGNILEEEFPDRSELTFTAGDMVRRYDDITNFKIGIGINI